MIAPSLHPRLQATIDAFTAAGVTLASSEVCWLYSLRMPCDRPSDGSVPWVMGAALTEMGYDWYPLHDLALSWWLRYMRLFEGEPATQALVYLYAHVRSGPNDISLRKLNTLDKVRKRVHKWRKTLPLHDDKRLNELQDRLSELDDTSKEIPDPDHAEDGSEDVQDRSQKFIAAMCRAFPGVSPEYWATGISRADAVRMLETEISDDFSRSEQRREAIANYLKAVKWLWRRSEDGQ